MKRLVGAGLLAAYALAGGRAAAETAFSYDPPGKLAAQSGSGRIDTTVYAPGMRFPIESGPAFANSQVYSPGGGEVGGDQCDKRNYGYPWKDNYCEKRSWSMPLCPSGTGHQGQDLRAATCAKDTHWVVAVVDGTITNVGSYSVYLTAADGTRFDYLHMSTLQVKVGQKVARGERIGKVSNQFGGTPTTTHLHFNIKQNVSGVGDVYVPPYVSLVEAYEELLGLRVPDAGAPPGEPAAVPVAIPRPPPETTSVTIEASEEAAMEVESTGCRAAAAGTSRGGAAFATLGLLLGLGRRVRRQRHRTS